MRGVTAEHEPNPFSEPAWTTPHGLPPFERIVPAHYEPAFERALAQHVAEIEAIAGNPEPATFANTIEAMERSGQALRRVSSTFFNLTGSHTNPELQAVERAVSPRLARHGSAIYLNPDLWARVSGIAEDGLSDEQKRVRERYRLRFRRAGAELDAESKERMAAIASRLAELGTQFSQNLLADEGAFTLELTGEDDLAGLPPFLRAAASRAAEERGLKNSHVVTLSRSLIDPFLVFSTRRDLRERAYAAWLRRGENGGRPTTGRSSPRPCACAPSGRACWVIRAMPPSASTTRWRAAPTPRSACWRRSGRRPAAGPKPSATGSRRSPARTATISTSLLTTGATMPSACAAASTTSTRARSSRISRWKA